MDTLMANKILMKIDGTIYREAGILLYTLSLSLSLLMEQRRRQLLLKLERPQKLELLLQAPSSPPPVAREHYSEVVWQLPMALVIALVTALVIASVMALEILALALARSSWVNQSPYQKWRVLARRHLELLR